MGERETGLRSELSKTGAPPSRRWRKIGGKFAMAGTEIGPSLSSEVAKPSAAMRWWSQGLVCGREGPFGLWETDCPESVPMTDSHPASLVSLFAQQST